MSRFQSIEDIRDFCDFLLQLATDIGDERTRHLLQETLAANNTSSPTERLGEALKGLLAAREMMLKDDRYSADVISELNEVIKTGQKAMRKANRPWPWSMCPFLNLFERFP
ncbi:MAG: hypothetical protein LC131_18935 [Anaerolineae bacterium]|nr:hypothetical protein [Promineifilum sp.]MCZ2115886.1 hypothetical protein [Anaerolineae bacterium]